MAVSVFEDPFNAAAAGGVSRLAKGEKCVLKGLAGSSSAKALFLAHTFVNANKSVLAILPDTESAEEFARDLRFFLGADRGLGRVLLYPFQENLHFETGPLDLAIRSIRSERTAFLHKLLTAEAPLIAVATGTSLLERVVPRTALERGTINIQKGAENAREEFLARLRETGYQWMSMVEERGEASVRGGIVDVYPPGSSWPLRVEFFGDEVESIREFDPATQRSVKELDSAVILPATWADLSEASLSLARARLLERADLAGLDRAEWEPLYKRLLDAGEATVDGPADEGIKGMDAMLPLFYEKLDTIFDYLPQEGRRPDFKPAKPAGTINFLVDPEGVYRAIEDRPEDRVDESAEEIALKKAGSEGYQLKELFGGLYMDADGFQGHVEGSPLVLMEGFIEGAEAPSGAHYEVAYEVSIETNLDLRQDIAIKKDLGPLAERIKGWFDRGMSVFITAHNRGQASRMKELMEGYGFKPVITSGGAIVDAVIKTFRPGVELPKGRALKSPRLWISQGVLSGGFRLPSKSLVVVTEEEVFGERVKRRPPSSKKIDAFLTELTDLKDGDYIVHTLHGIGVYRGLARLGFDNIDNDYLLIEYRDADKLYVPVERLDLVSKYHAFEGHGPLVDKLGGTGWEKVKKRVSKAVESIAGELIKLYAARLASKGYSFSNPGALFTEFEEAFEFDETPDQERAIEEVMGDMSGGKPMDRLVCGDVGYGKTEVAMRAVFRAALDSKQSAVLVPTTVLAQQHGSTFAERFAPFPVTIEVLSRFKSRKEQAGILKRVASGEVDVLIGTHRLLGRDVRFKDLGLIVVDEEHRFGVRHKERLKELKKEVDVLTLTATPIPRTMQMSLAGIRDLSVINTPPEDRLAITTRVVRFDERLISEALGRELNRGG
jgi:transcription-repair coupling factor (superfamily II helicase)